jgi:hypothetical protein|tara:strand:- start:106 stop:327 length:222 start_codon:yes stop_codon:yes gene_type:complete
MNEKIIPMQGINPAAFSGQRQQQMPAANINMNQYLLQKIDEIKRRMFGDNVGALANIMMQQQQPMMQQPRRRM